MTRKSPIRSMFVAGMMALAPTFLSSCTQGGSVHPGDANRTNTAPDNYQHVVQSGETLGMISDWYTGKASNWTLIVNANPGLRPERLRPGQIVLIPRNILIKDTPIPKGYALKRKGTPVSAGNATGVDADKVEPAGEKADESAGTESTGTETVTKSGGETVDGGDLGSKVESGTDNSKSQAEAAAKAAEEAALADKNDAELAAEKAKADAAAAAKAASEAAADAAAAAKNGTKANPDDAEREKLLDELLAQ